MENQNHQMQGNHIKNSEGQGNSQGGKNHFGRNKRKPESINTTRHSRFTSWLFSTCMISMIPSIFYIMCVVCINDTVFKPRMFLHEFAFFSIVLLTTMIRTVFFGSGKEKYKKLYSIGAVAIIMDVIAFELFALVIVSEMVGTISLREELFPASVILCLASFVLGGLAEYMEDLAR